MTKRAENRVENNLDRYWTPDPMTGCHLWLGAVSKQYGRSSC